jgi:ABC-type branched-subunit amino acid transport system substrate-binding protein
VRNRWLRPSAALFSLVLVAAACGGRDSDDDEATDETGAEEPGGEAAAPEAGPGFDGTTIRLGIITPTSGAAAVIGNPLTDGHRVYFDALNAAGGVAGQYPVELDIQDSAFQTAPADAAYEAIKGDVVMFAQILGTQIVTTLLPKLVADNIVAAPASLDSFWVREQQLLPIGGPYQIQAANALTWYVEGGNGGSADDTLCALTRDDAYGEAGFEGLEFAAGELGVEIAERVTFPAANADFTTQIGQLQGAQCDMVFLVAIPSETSPALAKSVELGFAPQWIGQSPTWVTLFATTALAPYLQENFVLAAEGTEWGDTSVPGMAQLLEDAGPDQAPDIYFAFGYNQARAVHQVLEAAVESGDLSREGIITAMNGIEELTFDGLTGDYGWGPPEDRVPPRASTIFSVDPAVPGGLAALERDITSEAAENFEFE